MTTTFLIINKNSGEAIKEMRDSGKNQIVYTPSGILVLTHDLKVLLFYCSQGKVCFKDVSEKYDIIDKDEICQNDLEKYPGLKFLFS
jgi:hypothetical protein